MALLVRNFEETPQEVAAPCFVGVARNSPPPPKKYQRLHNKLSVVMYFRLSVIKGIAKVPTVKFLRLNT